MIVDFHTHIFPPYLIKNRDRYLFRDSALSVLFADPKMPMATAEDLLTVMDEAEVDLAVAMGMGWTSLDIAREINDYLLESVARYPQRLAAFCSVNPAWGEEALREIERCARLGAKGIGELHPDIQDLDLSNHEIMGPLMDMLRSNRLILLVHASEPVGHSYPGKGSTTPAVLMGLIRRYPEVPIVCAHWGGGLPFYALMPEVNNALRNTYFDTATSPFLYEPQVFSAVAGLVSPTSILMGSDYPLVKPQRLIQQLTTSPLTDQDKKAIIGGNAQKLLGLKDDRHDATDG